MNIDRIFAELELERSHLSGLGPEDAFQTVMAALRDVEPIGLAWLYAWVLMGREGAALISRDSPGQFSNEMRLSELGRWRSSRLMGRLVTIDTAKRRLQETLHEEQLADAIMGLSPPAEAGKE